MDKWALGLGFDTWAETNRKDDRRTFYVRESIEKSEWTLSLMTSKDRFLWSWSLCRKSVWQQNLKWIYVEGILYFLRIMPVGMRDRGDVWVTFPNLCFRTVYLTSEYDQMEWRGIRTRTWVRRLLELCGWQKPKLSAYYGIEFSERSMNKTLHFL